MWVSSYSIRPIAGVTVDAPSLPSPDCGDLIRFDSLFLRGGETTVSGGGETTCALGWRVVMESGGDYVVGAGVHGESVAGAAALLGKWVGVRVSDRACVSGFLPAQVRRWVSFPIRSIADVSLHSPALPSPPSGDLIRFVSMLLRGEETTVSGGGEITGAFGARIALGSGACSVVGASVHGESVAASALLGKGVGVRGPDRARVSGSVPAQVRRWRGLLVVEGPPSCAPQDRLRQAQGEREGRTSGCLPPQERRWGCAGRQVPLVAMG